MQWRNVVLMGVGDVGPIHEPLDAYSDAREGDARRRPTCGSRRSSASTRSAARCRSTPAAGTAASMPRFASVFGDCGFDVVSVASNHAMDWGEDALLDTIDLFRERGVAGGRRGTQPARSAPPGHRREKRRARRRSSPTARSCRTATRRGPTRPASRRCARTPTTSRSTTRRACRRASSPCPTRKTSPAWWRTSPRRRNRRTSSCCRCTGASISFRA